MKNYKINIHQILFLSVFIISSDVVFGQKISRTYKNSSGEWNKNWKFYKVVKLVDTEGLTRINEPVDIVLSFSVDEVFSPENEIRVVEKDFRSGEFIEVASQVYSLSKSEGELHVVFLANVLASCEKEYRIYFGNPNAEKPYYKTDLKVRGNAPQSIVENDFYIIDMTSGTNGSALNKCGQIRTIAPKMGFNVLFSRRNGYIHFTPDCSRNVEEENIGVKFMNPPSKVFEVKGPVLYFVYREGVFTKKDRFIRFTVIYKFYSSIPYFISETKIELLETAKLRMLRNDEFTFNSKIFTHNAWKEFNEMIKTNPFPIEREINGEIILETDLSYPLWIPANLPWLTFFNAEKGYGIASIHLDYQKLGPTGSPGITQEEGQRIHIGGDRRGSCWSRFIISGEPIIVPKGSKYTEKIAYLLYRIDPEVSRRFKPLEKYNTILRNPLVIK